jgi:hypothetical protein
MDDLFQKQTNLMQKAYQQNEDKVSSVDKQNFNMLGCSLREYNAAGTDILRINDIRKQIFSFSSFFL